MIACDTERWHQNASTKAEAPQTKFPVKRRKKLGVYSSEVKEDRYLQISTVIDPLKK